MYHKNRHLAWINLCSQGHLTSRVKTCRLLSEEWDHQASEREKPRLMGISSPLTRPVEGWYTIQGQQNRHRVAFTDHETLHPSLLPLFFCLLVWWSEVKRGKRTGYVRFLFSHNMSPGQFCCSDFLFNTMALILQAERSAESWLQAWTVPL